MKSYIPANAGYYALLVTDDQTAHELFSIVGWRIEEGYQPEPVGAFMGYVSTVYPGEDNSAYVQACAMKIADRSEHEIYFTHDIGVLGGTPDAGRRAESIISALAESRTQLRIIMVTPNTGLTEALQEIGIELISLLA